MGVVTFLHHNLVEPTFRPDDTPAERRVKHTGIISLVLVAAVELVWIMWMLATGLVLSCIFYGVMFMSTLPTLISVLYYRRMPVILMEFFLVTHLVCVMLYDLWDYGRYDEWAATIVVIDGMIFLQVRPTIVRLCQFATALFITLRSLEDALRFGLYPTWSTSEPGGQKPLGIWWGLNIIMVRLLVYTVNCILMKRYAAGLEAEKKKVESALTVSAEIADALARFDLSQAEDYIEKCDTLDEDQLSGYHRLVSNLHIYRPFLPDALFVESESDSGRGPIEFRQPPTGEVTIVFTDIESSSMLWETLTDMKSSLAIHNNIMRDAIVEMNGYEVKTIGDSFMVAFDNPVEALKFCLKVQCDLLEAPWPSELLTMPEFAEITDNGVVTWRGLRVRMGVHTGFVDCEVNPLTRRADYLGNSVNCAARIESVVKGGVVAVSDHTLKLAFMSDASSSVPSQGLAMALRDLGDPILLDYGFLKLNGISVKMHVRGLVPHCLRGRLNHVSQLKKQKETPSLPDDTNSQRGELMYAMRTGTLTPSTATIVHLQMDFGKGNVDILKAVNNVLTIAELAVERLGGLVVGTYGEGITLSWNAGKRTRNAFDKAAKFSMDIIENPEVYRVCPSIKLVAGLVQAGVLHGMVGSGRKKYATAIGWAPRLASMLCNAAGRLTASVLAISTAETISEKTFVRPLMEWNVAGHEQKLLVCEVNVEGFHEYTSLATSGRSMISCVMPDTIEDIMWGSAYHAAWRKALGGDVSDLLNMMRTHGEDHVIRNLISLLQENLPAPTVSQGIDPTFFSDWRRR